MLYESVRQSAALFEKKLKQRQTYEEVQVFRWKFVVLGLGVVLVILIGICSELIKTMSARNEVPINTTFLSSLLPRSQFFAGDLTALRELIRSLEETQGILFDNATLLFSGYRTSGEAISKLISGHENLLFLLEIADADNPQSIRKIGLYLHSQLPKIPYNSSQTISISDNPQSLTSTLFNLEYPKSYRLNNSEACYIYQYNIPHKELSLAQLFHFGEGARQSLAGVRAENYQCFGEGRDDRETVRRNIRDLVGFQLQEGVSKQVLVKLMEVFWLEMSDIRFGDVQLETSRVQILHK